MEKELPDRPSIWTKLGAWTAPIIALLLMISIAWFLMWRWLGNSISSGNLDPDVVAAIIARPSPTRPPIPPLRLANRESILVFGPTGPWVIHSGPYQMGISLSDAGYAYYYSATRANAAYSDEDLKLASLAVQLSFNPISQMQSGAPKELIEELRKDYARKLSSPPLQLSDSDAQNLQNLWVQYALTPDPNARMEIGKKLINALGAVGKQSEAANRAVWDATLAAVRQLIPPEDEKKYRDNIRKATASRFAASRPGL